MAWLGTALKSSQPSCNARCRSDRPMVRIVGPTALSCAGWICGVTLPWIGVAMIVLLPCRGRLVLAPVWDASGRFGTIAIGADARTGRPRRELKFQHTPKDCVRRSRLGEKHR